MKIAYVILHYNSFDVTCNCIESILKIKNSGSQIVVIDNFSNNNSGEELIKKYAKCDDIKIIINKENIGFARGNNIGYSYAKNEAKADSIVILNNDVIITQKNFENKIEEITKIDNNIAIIAPKIINNKERNQNPFRMKRLSSSKKMKSIIGNLIYLACIYFKPLFRFGYKRFHSDSFDNGIRSVISDQYNIVPHGSCIIYTTSFIEKSNCAFLPITFFYGEEDILYDYVVYVLKLKTFYTDGLCVRHLEKISTKTISEEAIVREKFRTKNRLHSSCADLYFRLKIKLKLLKRP